MIVRIQDIRVGDTIKESRGGFEVTHLNYLDCSSGGVHVNGKYHYDWNDIVVKAEVIHDEEDEPGVEVTVGEITDRQAIKARKRRKAREKAYA